MERLDDEVKSLTDTLGSYQLDAEHSADRFKGEYLLVQMEQAGSR